MPSYMEIIKKQLLEALQKLEVVKQGDFTLASGKKTNIYLDMRDATLHTSTSWLIASAFWEVLLENNVEYDAVGGPSIGADPIVGAMIGMGPSVLCGSDKVGFMVRKEPKEYGAASFKYIAGPLRPGMKAVLVEDVTTTGGSLLRAALKTREFGAEPVLAISLVDRGEGAKYLFEDNGIPLKTVFTMEELVQACTGGKI